MPFSLVVSIFFENVSSVLFMFLSLDVMYPLENQRFGVEYVPNLTFPLLGFRNPYFKPILCCDEKVSFHFPMY